MVQLEGSQPFCLARIARLSREFTLVSNFFKAGLRFCSLKSSLVEPGHRALKFNKISGVGNDIYREGWNFKMPYFERAIIFDTRTHPRVISTVTGSKGKPTELIL